MPAGLILASAMWCRYCFGTDETGAEIAPNDPNWDQLTTAAKRAKADPVQWLRQREIYGDLAENTTFVTAFASALGDVWANGSAKAMQAYLASRLGP
jgi:mannitol 2-dehydrogenase